jgi:hypothetical protein
MLQKLQESKKRAANKARTCMYGNCKRIAIKSHVLQKNGILREISVDNHLIQPLPPSPFEMENKGVFDFKKIGVNDVYTFKGFCKEHDNKLFESIESNENLDFEQANQKALLSYRGLCQEIRRKEIGLEWLDDMIKLCPTNMIYLMQSSINGFKDGIKNLAFFKTQLENAINSNDFSHFTFHTIKIPKIELCISVPLNIDASINVASIPFTTSFLNIFPKGSNCYVVAGYHNDYKCNWTKKFIAKMNAGKKNIVLKEISDLLTFRLEFWTMSPELFNRISKRNLVEFKRLFTENVFDHSPRLKTNFNLFKNL